MTFAAGLVERIVEESANGDPSAADTVRESSTREIGADLSRIVPGSAEAENLRRALLDLPFMVWGSRRRFHLAGPALADDVLSLAQKGWGGGPC